MSLLQTIGLAFNTMFSCAILNSMSARDNQLEGFDNRTVFLIENSDPRSLIATSIKMKQAERTSTKTNDNCQ
jgi:hypothetical protein